MKRRPGHPGPPRVAWKMAADDVRDAPKASLAARAELPTSATNLNSEAQANRSKSVMQWV